MDTILIKRDSNESDELDDDYFEEKEYVKVNNLKSEIKKKAPNVYKSIINSKSQKNQSSNKVYVDNIIIKNDSGSEDYGDEYFEEKGNNNTRNNFQNNNQPQTSFNRKQNIKVGRENNNKRKSTEEVFHEEIAIFRSSEENMDDDYFEERDPNEWKKNSNIKKTYLKNGQKVGNQRNQQTEQVYVDNIVIKNEDDDEDFDDEYFEERDPQEWKKINSSNNSSIQKNLFQNSYHNSEARMESNTKNSNISGGSMSSRFKSFAPQNKNNTSQVLHERFESFAPQNKQINNNQSYTTYIESKNNLSQDETPINRETKGPTYLYESGLNHKNGMNNTDSTFNSSKKYLSSSKKKRKVTFKDPFKAQIFTDQNTYNNKNNYNKAAYSDYYQK